MTLATLTPRSRPTANLADAGSWPITHLDHRGSEWSDESYRKFRVPLGRADVLIETTREALPDWLVSVLRKLNEIAALPGNWDSYGAAPVDQRSLEHSLELILKIMEDNEMLPPPRVSATVRGGVGFEWRSEGKDLEIELEGPFRVHAYFFDELSGEEWEDDVGIDLTALDPYLARIAG